MTFITEHIEFIIGGFFALIVWSMRLEGRVNYTEKSIDKLYLYNDQKLKKLSDMDLNITEIKESVARIEGRLGIGKE